MGPEKSDSSIRVSRAIFLASRGRSVSKEKEMAAFPRVLNWTVGLSLTSLGRPMISPSPSSLSIITAAR